MKPYRSGAAARFSKVPITNGPGKGLVKKYRGGEVGRSREGMGHEVLSLVQGVGRAIFS